MNEHIGQYFLRHVFHNDSEIFETFMTDGHETNTGWMDGRTDVWTDGWMDGRPAGIWMDGLNVFLSEGRWMAGWMDIWSN